jgi:Fic family protein
MRVVSDPDTGEQEDLTPGELRRRDVRVGRHVPVSPGAVPRFLSRFEAAYGGLGRTEAVLASAAAHHRLLWIHPFLDGNGRVARLMSHAMHLALLDSGGLWSVARGLARNTAAYRDHLAACDGPRRGDTDGRGALSDAALADFTKFFLRTCLDQVVFMERLIEPARLEARVLLWAEEEVRIGALPPQALKLMRAVLRQGAMARGEVPALLKLGDRQARRVSAALITAGALTADSSRAPLRLALPASLAARWLPGLFPEA